MFCSVLQRGFLGNDSGEGEPDVRNGRRLFSALAGRSQDGGQDLPRFVRVAQVK